MVSPSGVDLVGITLMLLWGAFALWLVNRVFQNKEGLLSFAIWPVTRPREFASWLAIIAVFSGLFCLLSAFDPHSAATLAQRHQTTAGTFIEYKGNHARFSYRFMVGGHQFHGYDSSDEHDVKELEAGEPFLVYYDPLNPNNNSVSEPIRFLRNGRTMLVFFSVLFSGMLAILVRKLGALMREPSDSFHVTNSAQG